MVCPWAEPAEAVRQRGSGGARAPAAAADIAPPDAAPAQSPEVDAPAAPCGSGPRRSSRGKSPGGPVASQAAGASQVQPEALRSQPRRRRAAGQHPEAQPAGAPAAASTATQPTGATQRTAAAADPPAADGSAANRGADATPGSDLALRVDCSLRALQARGSLAIPLAAPVSCSSFSHNASFCNSGTNCTRGYCPCFLLCSARPTRNCAGNRRQQHAILQQFSHDTMWVRIQRLPKPPRCWPAVGAAAHDLDPRPTRLG